MVSSRVNNKKGKKFAVWKNLFDTYLYEMLQELQEGCLDDLGLVVEIDKDYVFDGWKGRWLAVYKRRSRKINDGIIAIGVNYPLFYDSMCLLRVDEDEFEIEAQARVTVGHEIGHGLVDYIKSLKIDKDVLKEMPNVSAVKRCGQKKEEELVEEFGEYQFADVTGCWCSVLGDAVDELCDAGGFKFEKTNNGVYYLDESLNNYDGYLYHNTSMENLIKMMDIDAMKSEYHRGYSENCPHNGICFSREKSYCPYSYYDVRLKFDVKRMRQFTKGLKLVPYHDDSFEHLDEYEERLISRNGKPFTLQYISKFVDEVLILMDRTCSDIIENGCDVEDYIEDLRQIVDGNIFGDRLKIVENLKSKELYDFGQACEYMRNVCDEDKRGSYETYCAEWYDETLEEWIHEEYGIRGDMLDVAREMHKDDGLQTRVCYGIFNGYDFEMISIAEIFE